VKDSALGIERRREETGMSAYDTGPQPSGWVIGGITFASTMMVLIGIFQAFAGLGAIIDDKFFVVTNNYAFDLDTTAWGWVHLILGIVVACAGFALWAGKTWAVVTAIFLAMLSALANFFFVPYYPFWALLIIALNAWVIWALTRPGAVRA
jgi:hypothetical protein